MTTQTQFKKIQWYLIIIFLFFTIALGAAGYFYYAHQKKSLRQDKWDQLSSIADLKVRQIAHWRKEFIDDARVFFKSPFIENQIQRFIENPRLTEVKQEIHEWMAHIEKHYQYDHIILLDTQGMVRLSVPEGKDVVGPDAKKLAMEAMRTKKVILSDLYKSEITQQIRLSLLVPFFISRGHDTFPAGVLLIRIDPYHFLYPLIQSWPTPSRTSESMLVRREGDEVLFLNELRQQKDTALKLRLPIGEQKFPEVMAAVGMEGIVEGVDYRGVPVLAALRKIPDSPWFLVAKVDQEEIYAPIRVWAEFIAVLVGVLIIGLALSMGLLWRGQRLQFQKEQFKAKLDRRALAGHLDYLTRYANDIILLIDQDLKIIEANERAVESYGYTREELLQLSLRDLRAPEVRSLIDSVMKKVKEQDGLVLETLHQRKNGSIFPVEGSFRLIEVEGKTFYQIINRDTTKRKQAEEALRRSEEESKKLAEVNAVMAEIGRIINSSIHINEVYEQFGEEVRKAIPFDRIVINTVNPDCNTFTTAYVMGLDVDGRSPGALIPWSGSATQEVFHSQSSLLIQTEDIDELACRFPAFLPQFQVGLRSFLSIPLIFKSNVIGALHLESTKPNIYTERDLRLAERVGNQIAGAIANAKLFIERRRAEEALRQSEERYRTLVEESFDGIFIQKGSKIIFANQRLYEMLGYEKGKIEGMDHWLVYHPDYRDLTRKRAQARMQGEAVPPQYEVKLQRKDGSSFDGEVRAKTVMFGNEPGVQVWVRDITEHKRSEEERERLIRELQDALANIKTLRGMLPICAHCKKVRDDKGYWNQIEAYIRDHSEAEFSHGICPECMKKHYPDFVDEEK